MPQFYSAVHTVLGNSSMCLALMLDLHWAAHRCQKVRSLLLPLKDLFAVNSILKEKTVCQVSRGKTVCGYQFARAWPKRIIKQSAFKAIGWKTNAPCPRSTVSPSCPPAPLTNLCWRMGLELGPEAMGKGEGKFWSQGTVLCDTVVHTVTASDMGWQTLLHCSYSLLPPFSTTPINHTTWHSLVDSEPLSMLIQD